jgi:hypothetical protein
MLLAEVTFQGDPSEYVGEFFLFFLVLGGILFFLCHVVLGKNSISSGLPQPRKDLAPQDTDSADRTREKQFRLASAARMKASASSGFARDKRKFLRRGGNDVPISVSDVLVQAEPTQGLVLNRSRGGLYLSVPQRVEVDRILAVRTPTFPPDLASVQLRVRHCKQKDDAWYLGCQFVEELPWNVLLMFG